MLPSPASGRGAGGEGGLRLSDILQSAMLSPVVQAGYLIHFECRGAGWKHHDGGDASFVRARGGSNSQSVPFALSTNVLLK